MKKSILLYIGSLVFVSIFFLNFAFGGVNQIILGKLGSGGDISAFREMSKKEFGFNVSLDEVDEFVDEVIYQATNNKVLVLTYFQPIDTMDTDVYIYAHKQFNEILAYYFPIQPLYQIDFQGDFIIDFNHKNSTLHKKLFVLDHNIAIKSYSQLKQDKLEYFWNFSVYGSDGDIERFQDGVNHYYQKTMLEEIEVEVNPYYLLDYIKSANEDSLFLLIISFLTMIYFAIHLIKNHTDEISIRKLVGQSDWLIASKIITKLTGITILTVVGMCLIINLFCLQSHNYIGLMMLFMELLFILIIVLLLLICWLYVYYFTKHTSIIQIIRINKNYIKGFQTYQILKVVILLIVFANYNLTINYGISNLRELIRVNASYSTLSNVSIFSGFTGFSYDQGVKQTLFTNLMEAYYDEHQSEDIYALQEGNIWNQHTTIPMISMDLKTANYYGIDCENYCVYVDQRVYREHTNLIEKEFQSFTLINSEIRKAPLISLNEVIYNRPIIEVGNTNVRYQYYILEEDEGSYERYRNIVEGFGEENLSDIRLASQKKMVDSYKESRQKAVEKLLLDTFCLIAIIVLMATSLVQLYYSAYKTKLSVMFGLGKSNIKICENIILTEILLYFIVWLLLYVNYGIDLFTLYFMAFGLVISCIINTFLLINMIKKELTRVL